MKVTDASTYRNLLNYLDQNTSTLNTLRQRSATGLKLNQASDDPSAVKPALLTRSQLQATDKYLSTIDAASSRLQITDSQLGDAQNLLVRAKEIAVGAGNGTMTAQDRSQLAEQVKGLRESLLSIANTQEGGKYIFAGYQDNQAPFSANSAYNPPTVNNPVLYGGDLNDVKQEVAPGEQVTVGLNGSDVFLGGAGGTDVFAALGTLEQDLRANDPTAVSNDIAGIDAATQQITQYQGKVGLTEQQVDSAKQRVSESQTDLQTMLSKYQDADVMQTISDMTQQETALQAALSVTAQISKLSILNYM